MTGSTSKHTDVLIVGGGHAGAQAAATLRAQKFDGSITMVTAEPDLPYERPPLSKEYLSGARSFNAIMLRPESYWTEHDISVRCGLTISTIDADAHLASTAHGERFHYGSLIWATGGRARDITCQGAALAGVHTIRTRGDIDALAAALPMVQHVVIIGGGFIGLESAAVLSKAGKLVTVIEAQDRLLARVAAPVLSKFFEATHTAHGVTIRVATGVSRMIGEAGHVSAIELTTGEKLPADLVIVGIGIIPEIEVLRKAGAACGNGVIIDEACRTSLPHIFAIGDCALHRNKFANGAEIRLESVQNAADQAVVAAKTICGQTAIYQSVPLFWSNQYDVRLQTIGFSGGYDEALLRGSPADSIFSVIYRRDGRVIALDCVNAIRDYAQGRALVVAGAIARAEDLCNPAMSLKELLNREPANELAANI